MLAVLAARGLAPSVELRRKIAACRDAHALDLWLQKAATASSAAELTRATKSGLAAGERKREPAEARAKRLARSKRSARATGKGRR